MAGATAEVTSEKLALLGLWALPGIGPRTLRGLRAFAGGSLADLVSVPVADWAWNAPLPTSVRRLLTTVAPLGQVANDLLRRCAASDMQLAFEGDEAYPERLGQISDAPPVLFYRGAPGPARRRLAMVGSRHPDTGFLSFARTLARQVAEGGVGVVSGAAMGVDHACHMGAVEGEGETWAFLGSALDMLDTAQAKLADVLLAQGGRIFSELPPGVGACRETFPRRNRLISGASDAVLVLRAGHKSGSIHTADAATRQGRPVLGLPGDVRCEAARGVNEMLRTGQARVCLELQDIWNAVGVTPHSVAPTDRAPMGSLSGEARAAYQLLSRVPRQFSDVLRDSGLSAEALVVALVELELAGLVVQHPGKLYEKV